MRSLAGRLLALQLLIAAAAIIAVAVSTAWLTNHLLARQEEQELIQTAKSVAVEIGRDFEELGELRAAVRSTMEEGAPPRYRIEVLDSKRNLIFSIEDCATSRAFAIFASFRNICEKPVSLGT